jgi:hypothetical protein
MAQCPRSRSARRAGLAWAKPRLVIAETVTVCHRRRRVLACEPPTVRLRVTWTGLGGVGEAEVVDGDGLEGAHLDAAVAAVAGAVQHGNAVPGQAGAAGQQGRLVGLDLQQVVGLLSATRNSAAPGGRRR